MTLKVLSLLVVNGVLLAANSYIFIHRAEGYRATPATYSELYYSLETPAIVGFDRNAGPFLNVRTAGIECESWEIANDEGIKTRSPGPELTIPLADRLHAYTALATGGSSDGKSLTLQVDYVPASVYADAGNDTGEVKHLVAADIPVVRGTRKTLTQLVGRLQDYAPEDVEEAIELLRSHGIDDLTTPEEKIIAIGKLVVDLFEDRRGIPIAQMGSVSPWRQYCWVRDGVSAGWCGNMATIFTFLAQVSGVPTRLVAIGGQMDGVRLSGHGVAECYISHSSEWVFVDLTRKRMMPKKKGGPSLNAVGLQNLCRMQILDSSLEVMVYEEKKWQWRQYDKQMQGKDRYYLSDNASLFYSLPIHASADKADKIRRYLTTPTMAYNAKGPVGSHSTKLAVLFAQGAAFMGLAGSVVRHRRHK
jgi:hypothetical protein